MLSMQKVRLLSLNYQVYFTAIFNVVKNNRTRMIRLLPTTQPKKLSHYYILGLSLPLTVSAWTPFKKKESADPKAIQIINQADKELLKALEAADRIYVTGEMCLNDEVYETLNKHREKEEPELLWRLARSTYEKSKKIEDQAARKNLIDEAHSLVQKALELDADKFAAHKWMAIILNEKSRLAGLKEQIKQSFNVKFHMVRAVELNPQDPTSSYLLGQWCFSVAEVPWYQQKVAAAIFATPPTSTYEEALGHFLNAENMQPLFYSMNLLMLAKTYMKLNNPEKANEYLDKLATLPLKNDEDFMARKEGREILNKISPKFKAADQENEGIPNKSS